jgi:hypothetical protein
MIIGARTFQIGAGEQDRVVPVDRPERIGDSRPGVGVLLAHVALDGLVVVGGVGIDGFYAVHVAVQARADRLGQHLGVADFEVSAAAVPVVLARAREVRQQDPAATWGLRRPWIPGRVRSGVAWRLRSAGAQHADRCATDAREAEAEEGASSHRVRHSRVLGGRDAAGGGQGAHRTSPRRAWLSLTVPADATPWGALREGYQEGLSTTARALYRWVEPQLFREDQEP